MYKRTGPERERKGTRRHRTLSHGAGQGAPATQRSLITWVRGAPGTTKAQAVCSWKWDSRPLPRGKIYPGFASSLQRSKVSVGMSVLLPRRGRGYRRLLPCLLSLWKRLNEDFNPESQTTKHKLSRKPEGSRTHQLTEAGGETGRAERAMELQKGREADTEEKQMNLPHWNNHLCIKGQTQ